MFRTTLDPHPSGLAGMARGANVEARSLRGFLA
jgi:hypothetical protein